VPTRVVLPERERRAAQHHAEQHERDRHVERGHHDGEGGREGGEEDDDHEDQPHVVGFPDGRDGVLDDLALPLRARAGREQVPQAAAVIGAAGQRVDDERGEDDEREDELN
jgi:hypothetical protein